MAASDILFADVTDLLFRDVRNLSKPSGRGARKAGTVDWLAGLDAEAPEKAAHEITDRLADALAREHDANQRLAILVACEEASSAILARLEQAVAAAPLPLSAPAQQVAVAADSLMKAMGIAYGRLAEGLDAQERSPDSEESIRHAALRAIRVLGRRQLLAYRACATASAAAWTTMHDLYALSRRHALQTTRDGQSSIEQEYLTALLLALAEPGRMPREGIPAVRDFVAGLAPLARIVDAAGWKADAEAPATFLLSPGRGRAGHALSPIPEDLALPPGSLVVECAPAVAAIAPHIAGNGAEPPLPAETLRLLHDAWEGNTAERRFSRTQFMPRADMVMGYKEILAFFAGTAFGRRKTDGKEERENIAVSEWCIVNESPDGYGIRHLGGPRVPFDVGDLAVLQPREHNQVCVCLVRRISLGGGHLELGLQQLCCQASVVSLPSEDITAFGQQAILLPQLPGFGNAAGVIAAAGTLKPHTIITEQVDGAARRYKLGSRVATSAAIDFHLLQAA